MPAQVNNDGELEVRLGSSVAAGGDGLGRLPDGRVVFLPGGLPGELATLEVTEEHRDYARARVLAILEPSEARVEPPCPWVARGCGGCGWQHVRPTAQLPFKRDVVLDALRRISHLDARSLFDDPVMVDPVGYRTTVRMALDVDGRPAYRARHSHDLVAVSECGVAHPLLRSLIDEVRLPGVGEVTLRVGVAGGERLVIPGIARQSRKRVRGRSRATGVAGGLSADWSVPGDAVVVRHGEHAWVTEAVGGRRWRVSAPSFFQSGPTGADGLVDAVDEAVGVLSAGDELIDLYSGVGLLGGVVAGRHPGVRLTAVESDRSASADAEVNLTDLGAQVVTSEVGAWVPPPLRARSDRSAVADGSAALGRSASVVIADPARPGLGRPGVRTVAAIAAPRVVLVSCDPASLARDVGLLAEAGYQLRGLRLVDLFPQTPHVETVSWFTLVD